MRFGSVCSGIEAASVAWKPLGWQAAWFSEIEPFPCAVLDHHYPDVPNYGDMTTLPDRILSGEVEAPDVLCGGTPCQAFSVAGNRQSLKDARGNLSLAFCEIAGAIDAVRLVHGGKPTIIIWENVPGVLNTPDNAFGCFLGKLAGESSPLQPPGGRWTDAGVVHGPVRSTAWRVLDAQYFGLAQRRRRVFLCATQYYPGAVIPSEILFESDSVRRDSAPSRKVRETVAGNVAVSTFNRQSSGKYGTEPIASTMAARDYKSASDLICFSTPHVFKVRGGREGGGKGYLGQDEQAFTVSCGQGQMLATGISGNSIGRSPEIATNRSPTLACNHEAPIAAYNIVSDTTPKIGIDVACTLRADGGGGVVPSSVAYCIQGSMIGRNDNAGPQGNGIGEEIAFTQNCTDRHAVAHHYIGGIDYENNAHKMDEPTEPLLKGSPTGGGQPLPAIATNTIVRRLTVVECARLQGFPDTYLDINFRNKPAGDGVKYKALGNSWATPVVRWIGQRINESINKKRSIK